MVAFASGKSRRRCQNSKTQPHHFPRQRLCSFCFVLCLCVFFFKFGAPVFGRRPNVSSARTHRKTHDDDWKVTHTLPLPPLPSLEFESSVPRRNSRWWLAAIINYATRAGGSVRFRSPFRSRYLITYLWFEFFLPPQCNNSSSATIVTLFLRHRMLRHRWPSSADSSRFN